MSVGKKNIVCLIAGMKRLFKILKIKFALKNKKYTHLYVGSPLHGNLGDQQIRNSSIEFLKNNGIHFPGKVVRKLKRILKRYPKEKNSI